MTHLMNGTIIPLAGAYTFGLIGCKIAQEKTHKYVDLIALILCAVLSHGGGFTRDLLNMLVTHRFILPSAFTSWDSWMAAGLAYATYLALKFTGHYEILERNDVTVGLMLMDELAVANYTFIGASRMVYVFDCTCVPVVAIFAGCTALGGGLWILFLFRPNKIERFKGNLIYYLTTLLAACVASRLTVLRYQDIEAASLILSLFCASVAIVTEYLTSRPQHSLRMFSTHGSSNCHHESVFNQPLSYGAFFEIVRNPARGIHLHLTAPLLSGKGITRSVIIDAFA